MRQLLRTFFDGSRSKAVAALIDTDTTGIPDHELEELDQLIEKAKQKGH